MHEHLHTTCQQNNYSIALLASINIKEFHEPVQFSGISGARLS